MPDLNLQQFYTEDYEALRPFVEHYAIKANTWYDPYAGMGHLLKLVDGNKISIDIDGSVNPTIVADSFSYVPCDVDNIAIITNPPYSHRHILQKENNELYQKVVGAGYVDLYEYSIASIIKNFKFPPIFAVLPENFIASRTTELRKLVYEHIKAIQIHSKTTCSYTSQPTILVLLTKEKHQIADLWIDSTKKCQISIKADGIQPTIKCNNNYVEFGIKDGQSDELRNTSILLQATDGGSENNRIKLMRVYEKFNSRIFCNKISDRAYIQIIPNVMLTEQQIEHLIVRFNLWVDSWRESTHGLGLTSFRSNTNTGFRRKRLDFGTARLVINYILENEILKF